MNTSLDGKLTQAIADLKSGKAVMLYDFDGREEETDLIYYGPVIEPRSVAQLRLAAGAPLSVYVDAATGAALGLNTFLDLVRNLQGTHYDRLKMLAAPAGGFDPRFSITLDHRSNRTGCSHEETANTIRKLAALVARGSYADFEREFRSPGHVPLIVAAEGLLKTRRGHTELILRIGQIGRLLPVMAASEILDQYTGRSMSKDHAMAYAEHLDLVYLTGREVAEWEGALEAEWADPAHR